MRRPRRLELLAALVALCVALSGCAANKAYRKGQREARKGNWDAAVAKLTLALEKDPDNIPYKMALENARIQASRYHYELGRKAMIAQDLDKAVDELEIAVKYDMANKSASDDLAIVQAKIRRREDEKQRMSEFEAMKNRATAARLPLPVLSPRSPVPITLKFTETSLQKIFDTISKLAGVNILFDEGFRDKKVDVNLTGVTFQEALDQITFVNRLFYKVLNQNTLIIVPESPQKRRAYDEQIVRTFYLQNAEANDVLNLVKTLANIQKALANKELAAITVLGTPDRVALGEKTVEVSPGSLLTLDGAALGSEKSLDPEKVRAKFTRAAATAGSGAVVSVTFKGRQPGPAVVTLDSVTVVTSSATERPAPPAPGRVVVTQ